MEKPTYFDAVQNLTDNKCIHGHSHGPIARTTHSSHDWNINDSGMSSRITVMEIEV